MSEFCKVTLIPQVGDLHKPTQKCGQPTVAHGLCAAHYAERLRLGGEA